MEHVIINWVNIKKGGNCYQDYKNGNPIYDNNYRYYNVFINFKYVHKSELRLITECGTNNVEQNNDFNQKVAWDNFWHGFISVWHKILPVN